MTRESNIFVTRRVRRCLAKIAEMGGSQIDELANRVLEQYIITMHEKLWRLYERHDEEEKALLDTIKKPKI